MMEEQSIPGKRKAAILMVLLGDEVAASVYKSLPEGDIRLITEEIADLEYISPELASTVLHEYQRLTLTQEYLAQGGQEYANKLLVKAFGKEAAQELLDEVGKTQEANAQNLDTLQKTDPTQLAKFIQGEHPQTIALVLAHLNTKVARAVLMMLPEKVRGQAVKRLAQMQQFSPEMVKKISMVLHKRLLTLGSQSRRAYGGVKAVADLLNQVDQEAQGTILEAIEQDNAQLATTIRNLMFTFDDFLEVPETGIRELLGQVDKKTLATALKGASEDLKNHIFKSMSSRAVEMLKEDMDVLGPVRGKDVQTAKHEIVAVARRLEGEGKLVLKQEQEDSYVV
ncbi:MAG TPA: flagellar motor switch protein FliG [Methylomirabilota bacterium]|nr:flagellar motor switch protein FliG [Methylomirabilota bacterium]